jgi:hypothetical protein
MPTQREFDALQQQVRVLSRELAIRPVRTPSRGGGVSSAQVNSKLILILGLTQLYVGPPAIFGIKRSVTNLTIVPTTDPSAIDYGPGHGYGREVLTDGSLGGPLWVAIQPVLSIAPPLDYSLPNNCVIVSMIGIVLPVTAGGTTLVYQPLIA